MFVAIGQVQVSIGESGANIQFPVGEAVFNLNITKTSDGDFFAHFRANGKSLFNALIKGKNNDAQAS